MNWIDVILAVVILVSVVAGWKRGFLLTFIDLAAWTASLALGFFFYSYTADGIKNIIDAGPWLLPTAFLLTILATRLLLGIITRAIAHIIPESANKNNLNKLFGLIPGTIYGLICVVFISAFLLLLPLKNEINADIRNSYVTNELARQTKWANKKLEPVFAQAIGQNIKTHVIHPKANEIVELNFRYDKAVVRPFLEVEMLEMINEERAKEGLKPLKADHELAIVARKHSQDMFARGYFAHINPDGEDPFDRMKKAKVRFLSAGENLALAQTLKTAHVNLMNSPGHRANILNPSFGRVGIGIMEGGDYGLMISQEFRN